ncbi:MULTISPECIES: hypothetical protein [Bradyrhizobium]|uniref:hypothetical protein n=1 Tax=Bradyrhizobium TaxID=374 RepID=UPI0004629143|nr:MULTISPECIES: hypothetical protein [Bradyrhizobium]
MSRKNSSRVGDSPNPNPSAPRQSSKADERPDLIIDQADLPAAAGKLAERLASSPSLFQRGSTLVKLVNTTEGPSTLLLNVHDVVNYSHQVCRPVMQKIVRGELMREPVTLPERVAKLYLNRHDAWGVRHLDGICRAPILSDDGSIRATHGYDKETHFWCIGVELPRIPDRPTRKQAEKALDSLRRVFATFPFADALKTAVSGGRLMVDLSQPPRVDEASYLVAILTAVCRPSLPLAPGFIIRSPQYSGAGTGKGKLIRAAARIAFDFAPKAFTSTGDRAELDKRLTASLVAADPVVFLDNVNAEIVRSNLLAQIATENPCAIRPFRENTKMVSITTNAFLAITGNAIAVSEDLARRFLIVGLDAGCEDPERREFSEEFDLLIQRKRRDLLAAALTIWRWGRQNSLKQGQALGSFEQWASWCRDPLLALGCADPVQRISDIKRDDPRRVQVVEFFTTWHELYGDRAIKVKELDMRLSLLAHPHGRGSRQSLAGFVANLEGTRAGGFVMLRNKPLGKWGTSTYVLQKTD